MRFEKVSFEQYCKDCGYSEKFGNDLMEAFKKEYNNILLPKRATIGSAGYDFFAPFDITLEPNETIVVPTGISWFSKANIEYYGGYQYVQCVLKIYPKSGLGFKYQLGLCNTTGIIDEDYMVADNEGHIIIKLVNRGNETISIKQGKGFAQGIISSYIVCDEMNEEFKETRSGGFGSTNN